MAEDTDAAAFVSALYRKVLLSVKASNAIVSEDDGFHYHAQFSPEFALGAKHSSAKAAALVQLLTKRRRGAHSEATAEDENGDEDEPKELFDGPEPNTRVTDYADMLLDEAAMHLARFMRGEAPDTSIPSGKQSLETKREVVEQQRGEGGEARDKKLMSGTLQSKPQEQFDETIDNSDALFVSKLREKVHAQNDGRAMDDDDGEEDDDVVRRHPYFPEIKGLKFAKWQLEAPDEPCERVGLDKATYMWVDSTEKLVQMMETLMAAEARVIAVDLEHHSYRSYMGLTCLMQISTMDADFLVDTLALRGKLQTLNQVFCDPEKVKVLHGSDMDILWLQRDLGLYIVNLFDTGRAARLLQYQRFSLAYLLKRHCNIDADKQYQLADWRTRPLSKNMVRYAREDTRYLLFIYDRLKKELQQAGAKSRESLLYQTLQNSNKLCLQVYEKPRVTVEDALALGEKLKDSVSIRVLSELHKRVIVALYMWRDRIARQDDESVAYVMPNHVLMKLVKRLPVRSDELFRACHPVPLLVRKHALQVTEMILAEKQKLAEEESKVVKEPKRIVAIKPSRKVWNEAGEKQIVSLPGSKSVGRADHAPWKSGQRKAGVAMASAGLLSCNDVHPMALGLDVSKAVDDPDTAATLLDQVNAMVARTTFTIAASGSVQSPVIQRTLLSEVPRKSDSSVETAKLKVPQSISETYHMSSRSKRRKTTPVDTSSALQVKDRAQTFLQKVEGDGGENNDAEDKINFQDFDYAAASDQVTAAKFQLKKDEDEGCNGGRGRGRGRGRGNNNKTPAGYNPFVAMRSSHGANQSSNNDSKKNGPKAAQVKRMHHMPRSATFR
uniref:HRDC domain-containing protein n=1 Tax=Hyaloperonospora arabidopsidis (strain Emoy2) TaxID=559515 RepID=M4BE86_HYAAE